MWDENQENKVRKKLYKIGFRCTVAQQSCVSHFCLRVVSWSLEAWHSTKNKNTINEHIEFPRIYYNLKNFN